MFPGTAFIEFVRKEEANKIGPLIFNKSSCDCITTTDVQNKKTKCNKQ